MSSKLYYGGDLLINITPKEELVSLLATDPEILDLIPLSQDPASEEYIQNNILNDLCKILPIKIKQLVCPESEEKSISFDISIELKNLSKSSKISRDNIQNFMNYNMDMWISLSYNNTELLKILIPNQVSYAFGVQDIRISTNIDEELKENYTLALFRELLVKKPAN